MEGFKRERAGLGSGEDARAGDEFDFVAKPRLRDTTMRARSGRRGADYRPPWRRSRPIRRRARRRRVRPVPAPMTTTSGIGLHLHSLFARYLAALRVGASIDGDAAFEADAHAAERRARLAGDRAAETDDAGRARRRRRP